MGRRKKIKGKSTQHRLLNGSNGMEWRMGEAQGKRMTRWWSSASLLACLPLSRSSRWAKRELWIDGRMEGVLGVEGSDT